jgi:hypothetical protein
VSDEKIPKIDVEEEANEITKKEYEILKEHEKLWNDKFSIRPPNFDVKTCINQIKFYLNIDDDQVLNHSQMTELFDYVATKAYYFAHINEKFREVLRSKMSLFYHTNPELLSLLKPETRTFMYALTGLQ